MLNEIYDINLLLSIKEISAVMKAYSSFIKKIEVLSSLKSHLCSSTKFISKRMLIFSLS